MSNRAGRGALLAATIVLLSGIGFVTVEGAERISSAVLHVERFEREDLLLTGCLAIAALRWFVWRRWNDALRELDARRASERQNASYVRRLQLLSSRLLSSGADRHREKANLLVSRSG